MKKFFYYTFIFVLGLLPLYNYAQNIYERYSYGYSDGLYGNNIRCFLQDKKGKLWIGTTAGLNSYDGKAFKNYGREAGLTNLFVEQLVNYKDSVLLVGTRNGLFAFNGFYFKQVLPNFLQDISDLKVDVNGKIWCTTNGQIYSGTINELKKVTIIGGKKDLIFKGIAFGKRNTVWVTTDKELVGLNSYTLQLNKYLPFENKYNLISDVDENLWFLGNNKVYKFNGNDLDSINVPNNNRLMSICVANNGSDIYVASKYLFSIKKGIASLVDSLPSFVTSLLEDKQGNIWAGEFECYQLKKRNFKKYISKPNLENAFFIPSVTAYSFYGNKYDNKIYEVENATFTENKVVTKIAAKEKAKFKQSFNIVLRDNNDFYWIATGVKLSKYDKNGGLLSTFSFNENALQFYIYKIVNASNETFITTSLGVYKISNGDIIKILPNKSFQNQVFLDAINDGLGNIWFTGLDGLYKYKSGTIAKTNLDNQIPDGRVKTLMLLNNYKLAIAVESYGVYIFDIQRNKISQVIKKDNNLIDIVFSDKEGNLICNYEDGKTYVYALKNDKLKYIENPFLEITGLKDFLSFSSYDLRLDKQNNFYILGSDNSLYYLNNNKSTYTNLNTAYVSNLMVNGKLYQSNESNTIAYFNTVPKYLKLAYSENSFSIDLSAIDLLNQEETLLQYALVTDTGNNNLEKKLFESQTKSYIKLNFSQLPPGKYYFVFRSKKILIIYLAKRNT
jgi:ligand-binding sensor domain-containing protein